MNIKKFTQFIFVMFISCHTVFAESSSGEVLYERQLSSDEKSRYQMSHWDEILDSEHNREQHRQAILSNTWQDDWRIVKVELLEDEKTQTAMTRVWSLGKDILREKRQTEWSQTAIAKFSLNKEKITATVQQNPVTFTLQQTNAQFSDNPLDINLAEQDQVGWFYQNYHSNTGEQIAISIYESLQGELPFNEFAKKLLAYKLDQKTTKNGEVITFSQHARPSDNKQSFVSGLAWIAENKYAIYIAGTNVNWQELQDLLGQRFISSLSQDVNINKTQWLRDSTTLELQALKRASSHENYLFHLNRIVNQIQAPASVLETAYEHDSKRNKILSEDLSNWWRQYKHQSHYNELLRALVIKE